MAKFLFRTRSYGRSYYTAQYTHEYVICFTNQMLTLRAREIFCYFFLIFKYIFGRAHIYFIQILFEIISRVKKFLVQPLQI